jgi:hypothetical protein
MLPLLLGESQHDRFRPQDSPTGIEDETSGDADGREEGVRAAVVTGWDTLPVLEPVNRRRTLTPGCLRSKY